MREILFTFGILLIITVSLSSCTSIMPSKPQSPISLQTDSYVEREINKAYVFCDGGGYAFSSNHNSEEEAIFAAFWSAELVGNNVNSCHLSIVNSSNLSDPLLKAFWRKQYLERKNNYLYEYDTSNRAVRTKRNPRYSRKVTSSGTAFFINSKGDVLTNFHVVNGCESSLQLQYNNQNLDLTLLAKDEFLDLALLSANLENTQFIEFSDQPPKKLQRIIVAGYPLGVALSNDLKFVSGIISSLKGLNDDSTRIQVDAAINFGNSGGPIINEQNGELLGIAVSGLKAERLESLNFGIKIASIKNFLESNEILWTVSKKEVNSVNRSNLAAHLENTTHFIFCSD